MSFSPADLRFMLHRGLGLIRRGWASLRTRGWRTTVDRVHAHFRRAAPLPADQLYAPPATPFAPFALPVHDAPVASIVIPVYDQFAHTLACLRALAAHPPAAAFETIVVDDGTDDLAVYRKMDNSA